MVRREIELDEETDEILTGLASQSGDNVGVILAEIVQSHAGIEELVSLCEETNEDALRRQRDQSEREFREGKIVAWDDLKKRNGL
jgi:hypothetical protein